MFKNIRIVLVETSHPGNIGAAARAMKTMGLEQLYLVNPKQFPHAEARARAANAVEVVERAVVVNDFIEAIGECHLVIGTSARLRKLPWPLLEPGQAAELIGQQPDESKIAIVFGREQNGLTNEELATCQYQIAIPTADDYGILNLAAAVQIISYELFLAQREERRLPEAQGKPAPTADMERFYQHLEDVLLKTEFLDPKQPETLMRRLRRFFNRGKPDKQELNMLRGILTACERSIKS